MLRDFVSGVGHDLGIYEKRFIPVEKNVGRRNSHAQLSGTALYGRAAGGVGCAVESALKPKGVKFLMIVT